MTPQVLDDNGGLYAWDESAATKRLFVFSGGGRGAVGG